VTFCDIAGSLVRPRRRIRRFGAQIENLDQLFWSRGVSALPPFLFYDMTIDFIGPAGVDSSSARAEVSRCEEVGADAAALEIPMRVWL
jgi:hypothetical protein